MDQDESRPWWRVNAIFDPEGEGRDFGYTTGLAERGAPELHLWSRPSLGEDPGLDWKLSMADTGQILNELARKLLDDALHVGDTWTEEYDAGFVQVRFEVGEPMAAAELEAFQSGDVPVLPIRWELQREPVRDPSAMESRDEVEAARLLDAVLDELDLARGGPPGWSVPGPDPTWAPDQPFGPRTPLVLARAAQVWQSDEGDLVEQASNAMTLYGRRQPGYATQVARAAARGAGRLDAVDRLTEAAKDLAAGLGGTWAPGAASGMRAWLVEEMEDDGAEVEAMYRGLVDLVGDQIVSLLAVEAVADLLPPWVVVWGQGPFLTAATRSGIAPDGRWSCSEQVAEVVTRVFSSTPGAVLADAAVAWYELGGSEGALWLEALRITGATHAPFVGSLLAASGVPVVAHRLDELGLSLLTLQQWANALAAVLSERSSLDQGVVDTFLSCAQGVPGLTETVNAPIALDQEDDDGWSWLRKRSSGPRTPHL